MEYLMKKDEPGYVFAATPALSVRSDMIPCDAKGRPLLFGGGEAGGLPPIALDAAAKNMQAALNISEEMAMEILSGNFSTSVEDASGLSLKRPEAVAETAKEPPAPVVVPNAPTPDALASLKTKQDIAEWAIQRFANFPAFKPFPVNLSNISREEMEAKVAEWERMEMEAVVAAQEANDDTPEEKTGYEQE